jgi:hypothetical protein
MAVGVRAVVMPMSCRTTSVGVTNPGRTRSGQQHCGCQYEAFKEGKSQAAHDAR